MNEIIEVALLLISGGLLAAALVIRWRNNKMMAVKEKKLEEAKREAEEISRTKTVFLSRLSHEIRTPMNAVVGITALAKVHLDDKKKMSEYLEKINASSKVLLTIINDMLDMSALQSEKLRLTRSPFDLKELLSALSNMFYYECKKKGVQFEMFSGKITEELLIGDSLRLNQILLNVMSDAYRFTDKGGKISVEAKQTEKREKTVFFRFIISDTGIGMSEESRKQIFEPMFQRKDGGQEGSGLGLSITKQLITLMEGNVQVESAVGKGTTFTIDLPFEIGEKRPGMDYSKFRNVRALVVDDDENTRDYTAVILERIGVQFDVAKSGVEALEILTRARQEGSGYDICFVDWKMPGLNGIEVTKKIRELFDEDTVIIIVSAYDLSEVEDEATAAGVNLFVPKPLFQSTIFDVLMNLSGGEYVKNTAETGKYDFTGKKVLLAEDNVLNAEIAAELLRMVHMEVEIAENGELALELFEKSQPDTYMAILMDIQMPVLDGHEAAKLIRSSKHPQGRSIPIYAMTANAFTEDITAALLAGMNGHIEKPIDTDILYGTLAKIAEEQG